MIQCENGRPWPRGSLAALGQVGNSLGLLAGAHPGKKQAETGQSCGCFTHRLPVAQTGPHTFQLVVGRTVNFQML